MPNNCYNIVRIVGLEEDLNVFEEKSLTFSHFYPPPENADDMDWCNNHWGTKWDPYNIDIERVGAHDIEFRFNTAWAPPIPFLQHLLTQYSKCWIKIQYNEPMMNLAGVWIGYVKNGLMKDKWLEWIEPIGILTTEGEVMTE